jgi:sporulation protein YlmC with PRC-barrel domain
MIMGAREVRVEELLGRVVRTASGRAVGRIEDLRVQPDGEDYVVREVILGELGLVARLVGIAAQLPTFRALGLGRRYRTRAVPWDWLDWSEPAGLKFKEGR